VLLSLGSSEGHLHNYLAEDF